MHCAMESAMARERGSRRCCAGEGHVAPRVRSGGRPLELMCAARLRCENSRMGIMLAHTTAA